LTKNFNNLQNNMKKTFFILNILLLIAINLFAQNHDFDLLIEKGDKAFNEGDYSNAIDFYDATKNLEALKPPQKTMADIRKNKTVTAMKLQYKELQIERAKTDSLLSLQIAMYELMQTSVFENAISKNISKDYFGKYIYENIDTLDFADNNFVFLPKEVLLCKNLKSINLIGNQKLNLDSTFAILDNLKLLSDIKISIDTISKIPIKFLKKITGLKFITDSLIVFPSEIYSMKFLEYLDFSGTSNNIHYIDSFPSQFFAIKKLNFIGLEYCNLNILPDKICGFAHLKTLKLGGNNLSYLPNNFGLLTKLETLHLDNNYFVEIPQQVTQIKTLKILGLFSNQITQIPTNISNLSNLQVLYIWENKLTTLPKEIGLLNSLIDFRLHSNQINTIIPEIGNLINLQFLSLSCNEISKIPNEFWELKNLKKLWLYQNQIIVIPVQIANLTNLEELDIRKNQISILPKEIGKLQNLKILDISENTITELPVEIANLQQLKQLNIEDNKLTTIPESIAQMPELKIIDFENNNFSEEEKLKITQQFENSDLIISSSSELSKNNELVNIPEMIFIKGGTFKMGSKESDDEKPIHDVVLTDFNIGKYEITNTQFAEFLNDYGQSSMKTTSDFPNEIIIKPSSGTYDWGLHQIGTKWTSVAGYEDFPVINVTWFGAYEYCRWLSLKTGTNYNLPSEAQWEYAAGGGETHQKFAGTEEDTKLIIYAWFTDNSSNKTHKVGTKTANSFGIYDMSGNVWEWCLDWYTKPFYSTVIDTNPVNNTKTLRKVYRGGSWDYPAQNCRISLRSSNTPGYYFNYLGFRIVSTP